MDKYEYNLRNEEINTLIGQREFQKAVQIADMIDWTKVRSVKTLCKISDLYKINRRYNEAKILLEQAYSRCPNGKSIVSSLCELCVRMGDVVGATEYYKMYIQLAPTDNIKFILLYKIYEAQEVTLDERIEVLEELKKRERIEKWCYELAYLYHRIGLTTRCVEECDDLVLWFREGRYVKKAMELKMLHQQLTSSQEALYQNMLNPQERSAHIDQIEVHDAKEERVSDDELVKTVDVGKYSTINIQKALEESIIGTLGKNPQFKSGDLVEDEEDVENEDEPVDNEEFVTTDNISESVTDNIAKSILAPMLQDTGEMQELFFETENTGEIEIEEEDNLEELVSKELEDEPKEKAIEESSKEVESNENIVKTVFPNVPVTNDTIIYNKGSITGQVVAAVTPKVNPNTATKEELMELIDKKVAEALENAMKGQSMRAGIERPKDINAVVPPTSMQKILSQENDGQISFVVPESEIIEKQITGQINIEEYLAEWENTKKQRQQRSEEEIKELINRETGSLFTDFDERARDGILAKLEAEGIGAGGLDADKEYEEYLRKITEEAEEEYPEVEELTEIEENVENISDSDSVNEEETSEDIKAEQESDEALEEVETEQEPDEALEEPKSEAHNEKQDNHKHYRNLTEDEIALFSQFIQTKKAKQNLSKALDGISLASYTGNVFVTGDIGEDSLELAKNVVQYAKTSDSNFSGKIGKVSGSSLNGKDVAATVDKMKNGGLIIEKAGEMNANTVKELARILNQENKGILVVMQDTKKEMNKMFSHFEEIKQIFNVHIEIEELSDDVLVAYGRQYAEYMEFAIDEMGILALHTRIDEMQTSDHIVTVADVRDIVDEAIKHATKFRFKHVADVLFGRRYDEEDMIILKERDFIN